MHILRQISERFRPRLSPEVLAISLALLSVAVTRPGPQLWPRLLGLMVMVTVLLFRVLTDCTENVSKANEAMRCQQPNAAMAFTFSTGCLIASGRPGFAIGALLVMTVYFQIWRLAQATSAPNLDLHITYLPDPISLASFVQEQIPAILRRKKKSHLPHSGHQFLRWFIPITLIVFLLLKMG